VEPIRVVRDVPSDVQVLLLLLLLLLYYYYYYYYIIIIIIMIIMILQSLAFLPPNRILHTPVDCYF
jgi:hypothetical protein